jgi:hypothetical protein
MSAPDFFWNAVLPLEREVDPQLYDDLVSYWNKALVEASLSEGSELLVSAPVLFSRIAASLGSRKRNLGPVWPACAPQLLPLLVQAGYCIFLPSTWLEEMLRLSLVSGQLFESPVQLGSVHDGLPEKAQRLRGHLSTVRHLWQRVRGRKTSGLASAFPRYSIEAEQMLTEEYHLLMFDALRTRCHQLSLMLEGERKRNPRDLYLLDEISKRFCRGFVKDALAILVALTSQGKGRLCAVQHLSDTPILGFQYASSVISDVDKVILALFAVRAKLEARATAWQRVEQESDTQAREILARYRNRLVADGSAGGHLVITRSVSNAREQAMPFLQRKLLAQRRVQGLHAAIEQIERAIWSVEQAQDNQTVMKVLESGVRCVESIQEKGSSVEALSATLDQLAALLETNADFTQTILNDAALAQEHDLRDADLQQQLAALEQSLRTECPQETEPNIAAQGSGRGRHGAAPVQAAADSSAPEHQDPSTRTSDPVDAFSEKEEDDVQDLDAALQGISLTD